MIDNNAQAAIVCGVCMRGYDDHLCFFEWVNPDPACCLRQIELFVLDET